MGAETFYSCRQMAPDFTIAETRDRRGEVVQLTATWTWHKPGEPKPWPCQWSLEGNDRMKLIAICFKSMLDQKAINGGGRAADNTGPSTVVELPSESSPMPVSKP